jgi:uncharacterized protein YeaO (DUF488 family)
MLYTSYLAKLSKLPDEGTKILVTRWKPRNTIDISKYNIEWSPSLAPSELLLAKYKDGSISFQQFREMFKEEKINRPDFIEALNELKTLLEDGQDVYILCYEKDYHSCHRTIIREMLEEEGYKCGEWDL